MGIFKFILKKICKNRVNTQLKNNLRRAFFTAHSFDNVIFEISERRNQLVKIPDSKQFSIFAISRSLNHFFTIGFYK